MDPGLGLSLPLAQMAESQQALLTFHSELAFLVRTFFFVLIGAVAELGIFRSHPLLMAGTLGSLFLARWLAIQSSHWAWKGIGAHNRELIFWVMPRGLITVVLAIRVAESRGSTLEFIPGLAFAVILLTNALLVLASFRARQVAAALPAPAAEVDVFASATPEISSRPTPGRRWVLNALMLVLLTMGGFLLWYGNQPGRMRAMEWIQTHLRRPQ